MSTNRLAVACLAVVSAAAQTSLPELRVEAINAGSVLLVRNVSTKPLTAYLIELVDYPGSSYSLWQDETGGEPVAPGAEKRIQISNMTVGAAPEYVKLRAALFADGSSAGIPEKVTQLIERRRSVLETTRELIRRLEKAREANTAKPAIAEDLKQWAASFQPRGRPNRNSQAFINQAASLSLIGSTIARLGSNSVDEILAVLRASERALAASRPAL
jgi:hypothetical protein